MNMNKPNNPSVGVNAAVRHNFLELENYVPIDIEFVRKERDKVYNVPNAGWDKIKPDLETINNLSAPITLRHYLLNHLPYCVIKILDA